MVKVSLENKPAFAVTGVKTGITKVEDFHHFWDQCHQDGTVSKLKALSNHTMGEQTRSLIFGVSRVEKDPNNRDFDFFIATEYAHSCGEPFETFVIPACLWAIFESRGEIQDALFEAEMYAFKTWLPASGYEHAMAPELEVYPCHDSKAVAFWLPIVGPIQR